MGSPNLKSWIFGILIVSAIFRIGFMASGDVLPVMWDARRYATAALGLISYVDTSATQPVADERDGRYRFKHYYEKYIQGEQIKWFHYTPHSLTQARDELFVSGPLYPFFLAIIFFLAPIADFTFARLFGIVLDLLSNWLLILVALRLVGRRAAVIAGCLYAAYFPFVLASSMLLLETSTSFLILLIMYCLIRAFEDDRRKLYVVAGILTGLLILNKPTAMLLAIPLGIGYYFYARKKLTFKIRLNRLLFFVTPVAIIFIGWLALASAKYGQITLRDPEYGSSVLRQATTIEFEGYALDKVEPDYWTRSITGDIAQDPVGFVELHAKKFYRLWSRPFNDFQRSYLFPAIFFEGLHTVILWGSLMGLLLLIAARPREAVWPALLTGYYAFIHIVLHSISRYNFNAMPFVIIATAYLAASVAETFRGTDKASKRNLLLGLLLMIAVWPLNAGYVNTIFGCGLTTSIVLAVVAFKTILIVWGLSLVGRTLMESSSRLARLALPIVGGFVFLVCAWASPLAQDRWAEFSCRLDEPRLKSGTRIYLSSMPPVREGEQVAALLDIKSGAGRKNSFAVTVADTTMRFVGGKGQLFDYFYPKPTYDIYSNLIPIGIEEFRQWAIIPLPDSLLAASVRHNGFVDISVAIDARIAEENNFIDLYGNFDHADDGIHIPAVRFTSIERYVFEDDPRVRYFVKTLSDSAKSYYIPRNETSAVSSEDLSPSAGRQTGRYNIFLVHFKPDGSFDVY